MAAGPVVRPYSFKDVTLVINVPGYGSFTSAGQIGMHDIAVIMATERRTDNISADGTDMVTYKSDKHGAFHVSVQQTSDAHTFMIGWWNYIEQAAENGNVAPFIAATATIRSLTDTSMHTAQGISPAKIPDKAYGADGATLTWNLMCAYIDTTTQ